MVFFQQILTAVSDPGKLHIPPRTKKKDFIIHYDIQNF